MTRLIYVEERIGQHLLLNLDSIAWVHEQSRTVCTSGVSDERA